MLGARNNIPQPREYPARPSAIATSALSVIGEPVGTPGRSGVTEPIVPSIRARRGLLNISL